MQTEKFPLCRSSQQCIYHPDKSLSTALASSSLSQATSMCGRTLGPMWCPFRPNYYFSCVPPVPDFRSYGRAVPQGFYSTNPSLGNVCCEVCRGGPGRLGLCLGNRQVVAVSPNLSAVTTLQRELSPRAVPGCCFMAKNRVQEHDNMSTGPRICLGSEVSQQHGCALCQEKEVLFIAFLDT